MLGDDVGKTIINHPFGNGLYHLFMVIWGMVYCFTHIIYLYLDIFHAFKQPNNSPTMTSTSNNIGGMSTRFAKLYVHMSIYSVCYDYIYLYNHPGGDRMSKCQRIPTKMRSSE